MATPGRAKPDEGKKQKTPDGKEPAAQEQPRPSGDADGSTESGPASTDDHLTDGGETE
jgi:hypothetical protein